MLCCRPHGARRSHRSRVTTASRTLPARVARRARTRSRCTHEGRSRSACGTSCVGSRRRAARRCVAVCWALGVRGAPPRSRLTGISSSRTERQVHALGLPAFSPIRLFRIALFYFPNIRSGFVQHTSLYHYTRLTRLHDLYAVALVYLLSVACLHTLWLLDTCEIRTIVLYAI